MCSGVSLTVVVATSVSAFLVSSMIIFIIGFVCGHCFSQKVKCQTTSATVTSPAPVYEDVLPTLNGQQEQDVETKENVAYI